MKKLIKRVVENKFFRKNYLVVAKDYYTSFNNSCTVRYRMLHIKQIKGYPNPKVTEQTTLCKNCGATFQGNYCNRCGQNKKIKRLNFRNTLKNMLGGFTNIQRGFGRTLTELLYRPGYMMKDYIAGKRTVYFGPFQTLFILAAVYIVTLQLVDPAALDSPHKKNTEKEQAKGITYQIKSPTGSIVIKEGTSDEDTSEENVSKEDASEESNFKRKMRNVAEKSKALKDNVSNLDSDFPLLARIWRVLKNWSQHNKAVTILLLLPILSLATWMSFRKRTFKVRYNLAEHFFVQGFIACQILLLSIIYLICTGQSAADDIYDIPSWAMIFLFAWDYKQLFRDSWKKTFVRTLLMYFYCFLILLLLAAFIVGILLVIAFFIDKF